METIGSNLKKYRINKCYSNKELSILSGVARGYIHELEKDKYLNPTIEVVCKLCIVLEITPNELIPISRYKYRDL